MATLGIDNTALDDSHKARKKIETNIAKTIAARLDTHTNRRRAPWITAPAEFFPVLVARECMRARFGDGGFEEARIPSPLGEGEELVRRAAVTGEPLLVIVDTTDHTKLRRLGDNLPSLGEDTPAGFMLAAIEADEHNWVKETVTPHILNHSDLTLTPSEAKTLLTSNEDGQDWLKPYFLAGGVPALIAARLAEQEGSPTSILEAAGEWAQRIYPMIRQDPLFALHAYTAGACESTMRTITSELTMLLAEEIGLQGSSPSSCIVPAQPGRPAMPEALAFAVRKLLQERDPELSRASRQTITRVSLESESLSGLERMRLMTAMSDWEALDHLLETKLHLLMHLSQTERRYYAVRWPKRLNLRLRNLRAARDFMTGSSASHPSVFFTPQAWADIYFLICKTSAPESGSHLARVRTWFEPLVRQSRSVDYSHASQCISEISEMLVTQAAELDADASNPSFDDHALLIGLLMAAGEDSLSAGLVGHANRCHRAAVRLGVAMGPTVEQYPGISDSILAFGCLLAAKAGLLRLTRERLTEYDRQAAVDASADRAEISLARRYAALHRTEILSSPDMRVIELDERLAPLSAEVEMLKIALRHGAEIAMDWARSVVNRSMWGNGPEWEWWPLHYTIAMLDAQGGQLELAATRLERGSLPPIPDVLLRATIELGWKRLSHALNLVDQVLRIPEISSRWRLSAIGIKLACLEPDDPAVNAMLAAENWGDSLGSLVLFPERSKAMVARRIATLVDGLAGLRPSLLRSGARPDPKLTRRQTEVLRELAEGRAMTDIAERLFISHETVRSTAKTLYRKLQVHDRHSAVQVARSLGVL